MTSISMPAVGGGEAPSARVKRRTLIACILGSGIVFLDSTVVNVALPAIRADLGAGLSAQQWIVEAYLLTLSALLLVGGSLGDLFGLRRIYALGLAGFGATSLLCALAPSAAVLCVLRGLQGVAGALLVPSTLAIITATFPEDERGRAIGTWTAWTGAATVVGPLLGGLLVDLASWRWIFAINLVPVAITLGLIRELHDTCDVRVRERHVDIVGAALCAFGLAGPVFALIHQPSAGWGDPTVLVPLLGGLVLLGAFLVQERRAREPMLPLDLFASRNFAVGNVTTLTMYAGLSAATFFLPLFLQQVSSYDAVEAGLALMPVTLIMFFFSGRAGALADRFGPKLFMGLGPIVAAAGIALMLRIDAGADYASELLPAALVFGVGLVMTVAPLTATVLGAVDQRHAGVASGANNAIARVAGLLAIAALGAVVAGRFDARVSSELSGRALSPPAQVAVDRARGRPLVVRTTGVPPRERPVVRAALRDASVSSFRLGMGVAAALAAAGGLISLAGIQNPRRRVPAGECPGGALAGASSYSVPEAERAAAA